MPLPPERSPSGRTRFPAHGAFDVRMVEGPALCVVHVDATGPFNREMVDRVREGLTQTLMDAAARRLPLGHIATFHSSMLATPEAFDAFGELIARWRSLDILPAATAYVACADVEGRNLVMAHYRRAWAGHHFEAFAHRAAAETWMADALAHRG